MSKINYVTADGARVAFEAVAGTSVMQVAVDNAVVGIVAECGGNCMCATCHAYIDPQQLSLLPLMSEDEDALLDGTASQRLPNSRLTCQIKVEPSLDGLIVHLPERQV